MYTMKDFMYDIKYFDGTKECAQALIEWAEGRVDWATNSKGELVLLLNTIDSNWFVITGPVFIAKTSESYIFTITEENFKLDYVEI